MSLAIAAPGNIVEAYFTGITPDVFATIEWIRRDAIVTSMTGKTVFEQRDVEVPASWSQAATNIAASKYFHGTLSTPGRETSVKQLISRVVNAIVTFGRANHYFAVEESALNFEAELTFLLVSQYAAFNSPVWFNVGCDVLEPENKGKNWHWTPATRVTEQGATGYRHPQCSACFINSVEDSMDSILDLAKIEGMLFKWGSGSGTNLSPLRGSMEHLSGGGTASGPLSFMRGYDAFAGVIKSGGKTRRAAKMVILDGDHPDIEEFIAAKGKEEAKAHALMREGYDGDGPDSEAYGSVFFQNANNSVRVTDEFMRAAEDGLDWELKARIGGATTKTVKAADVLRQIAEETWRCGDPGMQFDTTINKWHTSKASGRINASNPCSEYMFLDDTACNLASLNLVKFLRPDGSFDCDAFSAAVRILVIAQDIIVDLAGYPTETIARNSHDYRPLGLGYANLGALLLRLGLPYDSVDGRMVAASITALMGGVAYRTSAMLAGNLPVLAASDEALAQSHTGAFPGYAINEEMFLDVMRMHKEAAWALASDYPKHGSIAYAAKAAWTEAVALGRKAGYRNAQVTVLAPTGTIGFLMDCDTTGIEPGLGLVTFKKLVGGGYMSMVNQSVPTVLAHLGYESSEVDAISAFIIDNGTIEGAPGLREEHLAIFDCALTPAKGTRSISWRGHVEMMAAVQPFLSGAISKTVNMPTSSTVEDIAEAYLESWRLGLKAVAIYRDGSKAAQPLSVTRDKAEDEAATAQIIAPPTAPDLNAPPTAQRHRLQDERSAITHKFGIGGHEAYITVGLYPNGQPGEVFIRMSKEGSTISGLMESFATLMSVALQHGVPLQVICEKLAHTRFEPSGWTGNEKIGYAKSIMDYLGRWMQSRFLETEQLEMFKGLAPIPVATDNRISKLEGNNLQPFSDAPMCAHCGTQTQRAGKCFVCPGCSSSTGCS